MPDLNCKCGRTFQGNVAGAGAKFPGSIYGKCPKCGEFVWDKNGAQRNAEQRRPYVNKRKAVVGAVPPVEPAFTPSEEQGNIFAAVGNAALMALHWVIIALAGTGKTFTLCCLARRLKNAGHTVACLAFTSKDADELHTRLNGEAGDGAVAWVRSNNGAGNAILNHHFKGLRLVDDRDGCAALKEMLRSVWINEGLLKPGGDEGRRDKWIGDYADYAAAVTLCDKARHCLPLRKPMRPTDGQLAELMIRFNVEATDEGTAIHYAAVLFAMAADLENAKKFGIDFGQQLFLPVYHGLKAPRLFSRVLVDEGQDQNFACRAIALMYLAPGGKIVVVGDNNQAIYAWRGADASALAVLEKTLGAVKHFALTLCRRCCKAVIRTAQKIVPEIQPLEDAPEGESEIHWPNPDMLVNHCQEEHKAGRRPTGYVICRMNAPLVSLCLRLMAMGIGARLQKGDILSQLTGLVDQLTERDNTVAIAETLRRAGDWASERIAKLAEQRNSETRIAVVQDKLACLSALADGDEVRTAGDLIRRIKSLYPKVDAGPDEMIVCTTVHGAKGREAHTVYILSPIPKRGSASVFDAIWESATDRNNTLYVAITRAKMRLVFVGPMPTLERFTEEDRKPMDDDADEYAETAEAWATVGGSDGQAMLNGAPSLF